MAEQREEEIASEMAENKDKASTSGQTASEADKVGSTTKPATKPLVEESENGQPSSPENSEDENPKDTESSEGEDNDEASDKSENEPMEVVSGGTDDDDDDDSKGESDSEDERLEAWKKNPLLQGVGTLQNLAEAQDLKKKLLAQSVKIQNLIDEREKFKKELELAKKRSLSPAAELCPKKKVKKGTKKGKKPYSFTPFGSYPREDRLREFKQWLPGVKDAISFAGGWSQIKKAKYFKINCGDPLKKIIATYGLDPGKSSHKPYSDLLANIEEHFRSLTDPVIAHQRLLECKQERGESVESYYNRFMEIARYQELNAELLRTHFLTNLLDKQFMTTAMTQEWTMIQTVQKSALHEMAARNNARQQTVEVAAVASRPPTEQKQKRSRAGPNSTRERNRCKDCGIVGPHRSGVCPAKKPGFTCRNCKKPGHFARMCKQPKP